MIIAAALGAFGAGFLKKKGENVATKEDFDMLRLQLQKTTKDAEDIKQTAFREGWLSQQQWERREKHYMELLAVLSKFEYKCQEILRGDFEDRATTGAKLEQMLSLTEELQLKISFSGIFLDLYLLNIFEARISSFFEDESLEEALIKSRNLTKTMREALIKIAQKDLEQFDRPKAMSATTLSEALGEVEKHTHV